MKDFVDIIEEGFKKSADTDVALYKAIESQGTTLLKLTECVLEIQERLSNLEKTIAHRN